MKKTLKSLLKIIIALVLLFFITSIAITLFVDINQYKKEIAQLVEKEAGLKLEINGDMKLTVFSGLKFNAKDVKIFRGEELIADITSLQLGMEAYSIYIGEPEVTSVKLDVKILKIFRDKNNQFNFLPLYDNKTKSKNKSAQNSPQNSAQKSADSTDKLDLNSLALKNIQLSIDRFQYLDDLESVSVKLNQVKASLSLLPIIDHHELVIDDPRVLIAYNYSGELELKQALINQYQISNLSLSFKDQKGDFIADKLSFSFIQEGAKHNSPPIIFDAKGNLSFKLLYKTQKGSSEPLWSQPDFIKVGKFDFDLPKLKLTQKQFQLETENAHLDFEELAIFESKKYLLDNLVLQSMNFNSKKITLNLKGKSKGEGEYLFNQSILKLNNFPVIHKGKPLNIMSDTFLRQFAQKGDITFSTVSISHESQALKNIKIVLKGKNNQISLSNFSFNAMDSQLDGEGSLSFFAKNKKKIPEWHLKVHSEKLNLKPLSELLEFPAELKGYLKINSNLSGEYQDSKFTIDAGHVKTSGKNILIDGIDIDKVLADFQNSQSVGLLDVGAITLLGPAGMLVTKSNDYHKLMTTLDNKGNSEFEQLNSEISFSDGIATLDDVAFSTMKNRLAIKGKINTDNNTFITFKVATINKNGCPIYAEEVKGSLNSPSVKKVNVLISGVVNPISSLLSKATKTLNMKCKVPFYTGVVKAPVK